MKKRTRLRPEERKAEILNAAVKLFNKKGYGDTTMADLVEASGLSFGGFYHYYADKADILADIMRAGNRYRFEQSRKFICENPGLDPPDMIAELALNKLLDRNEMRSVYSMLLLEAGKDERLGALLRELTEEGMDGFEGLINANCPAVLPNLRSEFFIGFVNSLFLGMYALGLQSVFEREKGILKDMVKLILLYGSEAREEECNEEQ